MNAIAIKIGTAVANFFLSIDTAAILQALSIVGVGMLGIFVVTLVIIGVVTLLNKLS
jgi:hypothetical protein